MLQVLPFPVQRDTLGMFAHEAPVQTQALDFVKTTHLDFLDDLQKSGFENMNHARPYLMKEFPELSSQQAALVLSHWFQCYPQGYN